LELCASIQVQWWVTVLCSETRPNAKRQNVSNNYIGARENFNQDAMKKLKI